MVPAITKDVPYVGVSFYNRGSYHYHGGSYYSGSHYSHGSSGFHTASVSGGTAHIGSVSHSSGGGSNAPAAAAIIIKQPRSKQQGIGDSLPALPP